MVDCKKGFKEKNGRCVKRRSFFGKVKGSRNLPLTIILSIISIILLVTIANLVVNQIISRPEINDFCDPDIRTLDTREIPIEGFALDPCFDEFDEAQKKNNQMIFYIFAGIGLILIVAGLFIKNLLIQLIALGSGGILVIESAIRNFQNTFSVIIVLVILLTIIIIVGVRKLK